MELASDFEFYLKFAKPLVINLPTVADRSLAAAWVKRLMEDPADEVIRTSYLKLLLFVLQKRRLVGLFHDHPQNVGNLNEISKNRMAIQVAIEINEKDIEESNEKLKKHLDSGDFPYYQTEFSQDLCEYAAVQEIPNFGVHGYYAISQKPITEWLRVERNQLPKAAKNILEVVTMPNSLELSASSPEIGNKSPRKFKFRKHSSLVTAKKPICKPCHKSEEKLETIKKPKSEKKSTLGASPPSPFLGTVSPLEERNIPTWGSNMFGEEFRRYQRF